MINFSHLLFCLIVLAGSAFGVSKPHAIAFSKWTAVKWYIGSGDSQPLDLKIRTLYVDGRAKEFTAGPVHDITDHLFVVRRVFRVNDSLPQEQETVPRWRWQRGGWLLVSRVTGHISSFSLPDFDSYYSVAVVSRLRRLLRSCGGGSQDQRADCPARPAQADPEKSCGRDCEWRDAGFYLFYAGMGSRADSCHFRDQRKPETDLHSAASCGRSGE